MPCDLVWALCRGGCGACGAVTRCAFAVAWLFVSWLRAGHWPKNFLPSARPMMEPTMMCFLSSAQRLSSNVAQRNAHAGAAVVCRPK